MVEAGGVALVALDPLAGVLHHPINPFLLRVRNHPGHYGFLPLGAGGPLLRVPATQDDGAGVPGMVMQIPIFVRPHDVVNSERPRAPPQSRLVRLPAVRVEQPPAAHVHLGAVGGHDVLVRG